MSITEELREYADRLSDEAARKSEHGFSPVAMKLEGIADRIDAEHEAMLEDARKYVYAGYVELPKDADGEYIHIGDVMEWCDSGETLTVEGIGSDVLFYIDGENAEWTAARNKRHHHEPTVEDVLREFTDEVWNRCCEGATASDSGIDELVAECAAKLRLAGEDA